MEKRNNLVKSIIKAVDILELLGSEHELGITQIANALDLDKSTVFRIVSTLKEKNMVAQNIMTQRYHNSLKLFELGNKVVEDLGLRRMAQPIIKELAEKTGETVNLAILDECSIVYIDKIESSATIKVDLPIGKRLPSYCTGLGKAILAHLPSVKVENIIKETKLEKHTFNTHLSKEEFFDELKGIREKGYSFDDEEYVEGLKCIAAPILDFRGDALAAISVAVPSYRYEKFVNEGFIDLVVSESLLLSKMFGYR